MSNYDDYFTNDDKPFAENLNDALLVSNIFDYTVTITVPNMYSNEQWIDGTSRRKAGVSICNLNEQLPSGLSLASGNKAITGTGTLKLRFYPNFNTFGKIKAINPNPASSVSKITVKKLDTTVIYEKTGSTVSVNNVTELSTLQEFIIELTLNNATMTSVDIVMENKQSTRYGADLKVDNLDGVVTNINSSSTDEQIPTAKTIYDILMKSSSTTKNGHTHGNINSGGAISTVENTFGSQDMPIIADLSESNKLVKGYVPTPYIKDTNAHTNIGSLAEDTLSSILTKIDTKINDILTSLSSKISTSNTAGLVKNDGSIDTMAYAPTETNKTNLNNLKDVGIYYFLDDNISNTPASMDKFVVIVEGSGTYVKQTLTTLSDSKNSTAYKSYIRFYVGAGTSANIGWTSWVETTFNGHTHVGSDISNNTWTETYLKNDNDETQTSILCVNEALRLCQLRFIQQFNSAQVNTYVFNGTHGRIPDGKRPVNNNVYGSIWVGSEGNTAGGTLRVDTDGGLSAKFNQSISNLTAYATVMWFY